MLYFILNNKKISEISIIPLKFLDPISIQKIIKNDFRSVYTAIGIESKIKIFVQP